MIGHRTQYVRRYCFTHGIIIATAILVVLFEVLPLTSYVWHSKGDDDVQRGRLARNSCCSINGK